MTLAELSKKIGVSTATISRVLNDDGSVSAATKEKILHDLEAYGYQKRPRRKSSLVQNSDTALALIGKLTNPIAVAFLNGIHESLQAKGKRLLISVTDYDGVQELDALQYANRNGYCGVFSPECGGEPGPHLSAAGLPSACSPRKPVSQGLGSGCCDR